MRDLIAGLIALGLFLFALGLADRLGDIADIAHDTLGRDLEEESLPKRIRKAGRKSSPEDA